MGVWEKEVSQDRFLSSFSCFMSISFHATQQTTVNHDGEPQAAVRALQDPRGCQPQAQRSPSVLSWTDVSLPG